MKALLFALAVTLSTAHASAQNVNAVFNTPKFSGQLNLNIENELISMIDQAVTGSSIHFSIYTFDRETISKALIRAHVRGVNVRGVLDGGMRKESKKEGSGMNVLAKGLPADRLKFCRSFIIGGSCRALAINHNKFMLFSQLSDGRKNVFALTSANWNSSQFKNQNDLLIFANDEVLFNGVMAYWNGLMNSKLPVPLLIQGSTPATAVYTFPNRKTDPVLDVLNQVTCDLPGSKIRVMQSRFLDDRKAVAQRLAELSRQGCEVKILTRDEPNKKSPGPNVKAILGLLQTIIRYKGGEDDGIPSIHSKVVAIDARVNGSAARVPLVLAGSHNLNSNSLTKNDELLARVIDRTVLDGYMKYWDETVAAAHAAGIILQ